MKKERLLILLLSIAMLAAPQMPMTAYAEGTEPPGTVTETPGTETPGQGSTETPGGEQQPPADTPSGGGGQEDPTPEVYMLSAEVYRYSYGKSESSGEPAANMKVTLKLKDGSEELTSDKNGKISFDLTEEQRTENGEYEWKIAADSEHHAASGKIKEIKKEAEDDSPKTEKLYVEDRYEPEGSEYEFEESDSLKKVGSEIWAKAPGKYVIKGTGSRKLATELDVNGEASESLEVSVSEDGLIDDFYIYNGGKCSKVLKDQKINIDSGAPAISNVSTEAAGPATFVKTHGIYAREKAELVLTAEIEEDTLVKNIYLICRSTDADGKAIETRYDCIKKESTDEGYDVVIALPDEATLLDAAKVRLVAEDVFGNKSNEVLLTKSEDGSNVTIELIPPVIEKKADGTLSSFGWYNAMPELSVTAKDSLSGLESVSIKNKDSVIAEASYEGKETEEKTIKGKAKADASSSDGNYTFDIEAKDNSGNTAKDTFEIKVDTEKPVLEVSGITQSEYRKDAPSVVISEKEDHPEEEGNRITVKLTLDGQTVHEKTYTKADRIELPLNLFEKDGLYTLTASAKDAADNGSDEVTVSFTKDSDGPSVKFDETEGAKSKYGWYSKLPTISAKAQDPTSGLASLELKGDVGLIKSEAIKEGGTKELTSISADSKIGEPSESGAYKFTAEAEDLTGNRSVDTCTLKIDLVAPELVLNGATDGGIYSNAPTITVIENEKYHAEEGNRISLNVTRDGKEILNRTYNKASQITLPSDLFETDGLYVLTANAQDAADNEAKEVKLSFTKDAASPDVEFTDPDGKISKFGWYGDLPVLNAKSQDQVAGLASLELKGPTGLISSAELSERGTKDSQKISAKSVIGSASADGSYEFTVEAKDLAGNPGTDKCTMKIDLVAPVLRSSGAEDGGIYIDPPAITINEEEKYSSEEGNRIFVEIKRDGKSVLDETYTKRDSVSIGSDTFKEDGIYTLEATAKDAADHESNKIRFSFTKDSTAPDVAFGNIKGTKSSFGWYNALPELSAKASDGLSGLRSLSITGSGVTVASESYDDASQSGKTVEGRAKFDKVSPDGEYTFKASARDVSGNTAEDSVTVKIDLEKPSVDIDGFKAGEHYRNNPDVTITEDERYHSAEGNRIFVTVTRNGKETTYNNTFEKLRKVSVPKSAFAKDGEYKVTTYAIDAADNKSETVSRSFVKDATAPVLTIDGVKEGKFYNKPQTVNVHVREHNFKTNKVNTAAVRKLGNRTTNVGFPWSNKAENTTNSKRFSETGTYTVSASAEDKAGNKSAAKKVSFTVDTKAPEITITGVSDNGIYTYGESVSPKVSFSDDYLDSKSVTYTKAGQTITNPNFSALKENDGYYTLTATATDKAGNTTRKQLSFIVNRFGSYFVYPEKTKSVMGKALQNIGDDISIVEHNVSTLKSTKDILYRDGKKIDAESKIDEKLGAAENVYTHIFKEENFAEEGKYELNVVSVDDAGNEMDSKDETGPIVFYVDRTEPSINVSGIEEKGNKGSSVDLTVKATDLLTGVDEIKATVNGEEVALAETEEKGVWTLTLKEGMRQPIKITAKDKAGNEAVYEDEASVSESAFKLWFDRFGKFIFGGAGALAALGGGGAILLGKKKKDDDEEEETGDTPESDDAAPQE